MVSSCIRKCKVYVVVPVKSTGGACLAVRGAAKTIFPERFAELDVVKETRDFYKNFFGYSANDTKIQEILSGRGMRLSKNRNKTLR
jgi:hypothetical protein